MMPFLPSGPKPIPPCPVSITQAQMVTLFLPPGPVNQPNLAKKKHTQCHSPYRYNSPCISQEPDEAHQLMNFLLQLPHPSSPVEVLTMTIYRSCL